MLTDGGSVELLVSDVRLRAKRKDCGKFLARKECTEGESNTISMIVS
jgi:hypothetical protein